MWPSSPRRETISPATSRNISVAALVEFALVFSLTWFAWTNGSLYLELHGRNTGPHALVRLPSDRHPRHPRGVAADASGPSGSAFAVAYAAFLVVMPGLWYEVRHQDVRERRTEFLVDAGRYVTAMAASVIVILVSAFLPSDLRLGLWAAYTIGWTILLLVLARTGLIGWARPWPWLLALLLVAVLALVWTVAVRGFVLAGARAAEERPF